MKTPENLRILIADDHDVVRTGLRLLLETRAQWVICGEATDGRQAVEMCIALGPDVVIMDMTMPNLTGLEAARQIMKAAPKTQIVILTMHESPELVREVLAAGARAFVLKTDKGSEVMKAVEAIQGQRADFFTSKGTDAVLHGGFGSGSHLADRGRGLTPREKQVVHLLAQGKSNKEVASELEITVKTAEAHRMNIMRKLNAHSVVALVRYAMRNNLLS